VQSAWAIRLVPLQERLVGDVRQSLIFLLGAVALVLLIGCVNVANLLLARASARGREIAMRQALGAGRKRLVSQLLTESLLLSLLGGTLGLAILFGTKSFLVRMLPESLPRLNQVAINWPALLFAAAASLVAGIIFGLAPALYAGRVDLTKALKEATRGASGSGQQGRTRRVLVVTEFALSLMLMIAAGLLLRSFWDLLNVPLGFHPENVISVRTRVPYPNDVSLDKYKTPAQEAPFVREVMRRARTLPGVEEVAFGDTGAIPLDQNEHEMNVIGEGQFLATFAGRESVGDQPAIVERTGVTPEYFHLMGMPLLRGRVFNDMDDDKAPRVAVVTEAFARTYWPNEEALSQRFRSARAESPWITVIGVIGNARTDTLAEAEVPMAYLSFYQEGAHHLAIFLRGHLDAAAVAEEMREQVQAVDPTLPVFGTRALTETVSASLAERRFSLRMILAFALTALLLAGLGIYGVISYLVNERTHEIGIRIALGAQRRNILRLVFRQGLGLAMSGAAVGLLGAVLMAKFMARLLYGVHPTDPLTFGGVALLLLGVALLGCCIPARRALRVDPMVALRHE